MTDAKARTLQIPRGHMKGMADVVIGLRVALMVNPNPPRSAYRCYDERATGTIDKIIPTEGYFPAQIRVKLDEPIPHYGEHVTVVHAERRLTALDDPS